MNKFIRTPKTKYGKWAMWSGLSPIIAMPLLGIFAALIRPKLLDPLGEAPSRILGFSFGALVIMLYISSAIAAYIAKLKGENSRLIWIGYAPLVLIVIMVVGELIAPH